MRILDIPGRTIKVKRIFHCASKIGITTILLFVTSCNKLVQVGAPSNSINESNVFSDDATAIATMSGVYSTISSSTLTSAGLPSLSLLLGLSADELTLYSGASNVSYIGYYTNSINTSTNQLDFWVNIYPLLFSCNSIIDGLNVSSTLTPVVKQQLLGEAKFIRAFCLFYLVNLYGDVPLTLSTDYKVNQHLSRTPSSIVWGQIKGDLLDAQKVLNPNFLDGTVLSVTSERSRPTSWAASALLARSYLFNEEWDSAEVEATKVINNSTLFELDSLSGVFIRNSSEAIWQLQPVLAGYNTEDARMFILPPGGPSDPSYPVYLDTALVNSFEYGDLRRQQWIDSVIVPVSGGNMTYYYPSKYKVDQPNQPLTEYTMVLRLAEQYLIRAEARLARGNISGSLSDINAIRVRAGLATISNSSADSLKAIILKERKVELFTEWGHRWLDLKRTNTIDVVMSGVSIRKGSSWNTNARVFPIPLSELKKDVNLTQNPGY